MNALPVEYSDEAAADLRAIPAELRPAAYEFLTRIAVNHSTCSRDAVFPRRRGREAGLWCRNPVGQSALIEVMFTVVPDPERLFIRRIFVNRFDRLPGWASDPSAWGSTDPWPVVDL